jgi:hypothetical protein
VVPVNAPIRTDSDSLRTLVVVFSRQVENCGPAKPLARSVLHTQATKPPVTVRTTAFWKWGGTTALAREAPDRRRFPFDALQKLPPT